jgi:hypothetical protein
MVVRHQRNPTRALPQHPVRQRIVHRRVVVPLEAQPRRSRRPLRPHRPLQPRRARRPQDPLRSRLPRHTLRPLVALFTRRTHRPQSSRSPGRPLQPGRALRSRRSLHGQLPPVSRTQPRRLPMVRVHQRRITRPLKYHHIAYRIVRNRAISPLVNKPRWPGRSRRPDRPLWPSRPLNAQPRSTSRPLRSHRTRSPCRTRRTRLRQQSPRTRHKPRRVSVITRDHRRIARPPISHHHALRIVRRRRIHSLKHKRPSPSRPLWPHRSSRPRWPRRPRQPNRPLDSRSTLQTLRPSRPSRSLWPSRPLWSSRPRRPHRTRPTRRQRNLQLRRMRCLIILLAIELHHSIRRCQRQTIVCRRSPHPSLHQARHIERHITPHRTHRHTRHRSAHRRQRRVRHAVLSPASTQRLNRNRPCRIRAITKHTQRSPSNLRRYSPRRQHAQVELHQSCVAAAHIHVAQIARVHTRLRGRHMRVRDQRRLHSPGASPANSHRQQPRPHAQPAPSPPTTPQSGPSTTIETQ